VATSDPRDPTVAPARQEAPPQFNFAPLLNAVDSLTRAAARYDKAYSAALAQNASTSTALPGRVATFRSVNQRLLQAERMLTSSDGLNGRPWYRHLLYAPGFYTGYGVKTMPGPREAIEQGQWKNVDREIARVAAALDREATLVSRLADDLSRSQ
jgi:N-acetylated-alpha-linked acidic dipeptidase